MARARQHFRFQISTSFFVGASNRLSAPSESPMPSPLVLTSVNLIFVTVFYSLYSTEYTPCFVFLNICRILFKFLFSSDIILLLSSSTDEEKHTTSEPDAPDTEHGICIHKITMLAFCQDHLALVVSVQLILGRF